jgi:hypothetical protein
VPRIVHSGVDADAVPVVMKAAESAARRSSRGLVSVRAMPSVVGRCRPDPLQGGVKWTTVGSNLSV